MHKISWKCLWFKVELKWSKYFIFVLKTKLNEQFSTDTGPCTENNDWWHLSAKLIKLCTKITFTHLSNSFWIKTKRIKKNLHKNNQRSRHRLQFILKCTEIQLCCQFVVIFLCCSIAQFFLCGRIKIQFKRAETASPHRNNKQEKKDSFSVTCAACHISIGRVYECVANDAFCQCYYY